MNKKKIILILLCVSILVSVFSICVSAASIGTQPSESTIVTTNGLIVGDVYERNSITILVDNSVYDQLRPSDFGYASNYYIGYFIHRSYNSSSSQIDLQFYIINSDTDGYVPKHFYVDFPSSDYILYVDSTIVNVNGRYDFITDKNYTISIVSISPGPEGYSVTFNSNGGSSVSSLSDVTALPNPLPEPTRDYCEFDGWYYDSALTDRAYAGDEITSDTVLYADWIVIGHTITLNYNADTSATVLYAQLNIPSDINTAYIPDFTLTNKEFAGWYYDNGTWDDSVVPGAVLDSNVNLWAKWDTIAYNVYYHVNGGSSVSDLSGVTALPNPLPIPNRTNYSFQGWYTNSSLTVPAVAGALLSDDVSLYAKWLQTAFTITYQTNGGSAVSSVTSATALPDPLPITTRGSYDFLGWYLDADFGTPAVAGSAITADTVLYARWDAPTYAITFITGDGSSTLNGLFGLSVIPVNINMAYVPERDGFTFVGWYTDAEKTVPVVPGAVLDSSIHLYAKWSLYVPPVDPDPPAPDDSDREGLLRVLINTSWQCFYEAFLDFSNQTTIGGITLISLLATLIVLVVIYIILKFVTK